MQRQIQIAPVNQAALQSKKEEAAVKEAKERNYTLQQPCVFHKNGLISGAAAIFFFSLCCRCCFRLLHKNDTLGEGTTGTESQRCATMAGQAQRGQPAATKAAHCNSGCKWSRRVAPTPTPAHTLRVGSRRARRKKATKKNTAYLFLRSLSK